MTSNGSLKSSFDLDLERAIANSLESNNLPPMVSSSSNFGSLPSLYSRISPVNSNQFLTSDYNFSPTSSPPMNLLNYKSPSLSVSPIEKKERTKEEIEASANRRSKIEETEELLNEVEIPWKDAKMIMEIKYQEYLEAKANFDILDEYYTKYKSEVKSSANIIEHQNILMDRGLLQDKYNISYVKEIKKELPVKSIEERFSEMENIGTPVKLRVVFPDGRKGEYITGSMQTFGVITEHISEKYGSPLKLSKIPGVSMNSDTTLQEAGLTNTVALRFYS